MVSLHVVDIGSEYLVVYLSCVYIYTHVYICSVGYAEPSVVLLYLLYFNGVSHAVQNEKLWKFAQSDRRGIGARSTGGV